MQPHSAPKGVFDILPFESNPEDMWRTSDKWTYLESVIREVATHYGFREIRTPIFEHSDLFIRSVGDGSDIVSKEMYLFEDKAGRSLALRPEGTASVARAFIENRLNEQPTCRKLFYLGPMFRYERPQGGRYRQHHQFGAEALGVSSPEQDVEVIEMLCHLYKRLHLKNLTVLINSVGDHCSRAPYLAALHSYLKPHLPALSTDSQARFEKNILRIFDSKDPKDQEILKDAPTLLSMLDPKSKEHFAKVCSLLKQLGIAYEVQPKLVRGLDYYTRTVFEITSGELGAQNTLVGGGRYDDLISTLGGPPTPAVGFATGLERLLQTMYKQNTPFPPPFHPLAFFIGLDPESRALCFVLLSELRHENIDVEMDLSEKKLSSAMQTASALGVRYCVVIGENERKTGQVQVKNMQTRHSESCALSELKNYLRSHA